MAGIRFLRFPNGERVSCEVVSGLLFMLNMTPENDGTIREALAKTYDGARSGRFSAVAKFDVVGEADDGEHQLVGCFVYDSDDLYYLSADLRKGTDGKFER